MGLFQCVKERYRRYRRLYMTENFKEPNHDQAMREIVRLYFGVSRDLIVTYWKMAGLVPLDYSDQDRKQIQFQGEMKNKNDQMEEQEESIEFLKQGESADALSAAALPADVNSALIS